MCAGNAIYKRGSVMPEAFATKHVPELFANMFIKQFLVNRKLID